MVRSTMLLTLAVAAVIALQLCAEGSNQRGWIDELGSMPIQSGGRVMPLDTYAKKIAVDLTTRPYWRAGNGPEGFSGKHRVELLCDLLFRQDQLRSMELITVDNRPFKQRVGLDEHRKFFSIQDLSASPGLAQILAETRRKLANDSDYEPVGDEYRALEIERKAGVILGQRVLPIIPTETEYRDILAPADGATTLAHQRFQEFGRAYRDGGDLSAAVAALRSAVAAAGTPSAGHARAVRHEVFYNHHQPWRVAAFACIGAIATLGISGLFRRRSVVRRSLTVIGVVFVLWAFAEQLLGLYLRITILGRPPVSNTFEAILWMGVVAMIIGAVAQAIARSGWYLLSGTIAALLCVLFAGLVPLEDQTNAIPAVLRSNYWLTVHVLTIVASYGVLMLAAVLGHVYLLKEVLLARAPSERVRRNMGHPLITQTYRALQIGVLLLTAGTILGGVWAAESWGRFWAWDPKETWALISIVVYLVMLHARYVGWIRDFGLAVASVVGFVSIVWTFYGVNYVMAAGLHSYGMPGGEAGTGSGVTRMLTGFFTGTSGAAWVARWVVLELAFVGVCKLRQRALLRRIPRSHNERVINAPAEPSPA